MVPGMEDIQAVQFTTNTLKTMSLIPGRRYSMIAGGIFGGGSLTPNQSFVGNTSNGVAVSSSADMTVITAAGIQNFVAAGNSISITMSGAGGIYSATVILFLCPLGV